MLARESITGIVDDEVARVLRDFGGSFPPVDVLRIASRSGVDVIRDDRATSRARTKRLGRRPTVLLQPEERPERRNWALAHELGELHAWRILERASHDDETLGTGDESREQLANLFAARLLLPSLVFDDDATNLDRHLPRLKARYATASHELVAMRLLDLPPPCVVTIFDNGRLVRRRSNCESGSLLSIERRCWTQCRATAGDVRESFGTGTIDCWRVHEPGWEREILVVTGSDEDAAN